MSSPKIKQVLIVGGVHGNEFTGIYLIKKFEKDPHLIQRSQFKTSTLLANPKAFKAVRRYIDTDLNRCFDSEDLQNPDLTQYEQLEAKKIAQSIQEKQVDFMIDLHSSTSNMGLTLILSDNNPFVLGLAAYLTTLNPLVKILQHSDNPQSKSYLRYLCPLGLAIEVGPIAQGTLKADLFVETQRLIQAILDYLEDHNQGNPPQSPNTCTVYQYLKNIDYPRNEQREIKGMIHPQLQDQDYRPLSPGDPMFLSFDDQVIYYQGDSTVFPVFINEAAYYEKGIAMSLTLKQEIIIN